MGKARLASPGLRIKGQCLTVEPIRRSHLSFHLSLPLHLPPSPSRVGVEGAHPEPQRPGERLHRGGAGPPGADLSVPPEGLLP